MPPTAAPPTVRQAIQKLSADCAIVGASERACRSTASSCAWPHAIRSAPASIDTTSSGKGLTLRQSAGRRHAPGAAAAADAGRRRRWCGLWLPPSIGGGLVNIALALPGQDRRSTSTTPRASDSLQSAIRQCGMQARHHLAKLPRTRCRSNPGPGVELIYLEDFRPTRSPKGQRLRAFLAVLLLPAFVLERWLGLHRHTPRRPGDGDLLQRQHRRAQGRDADARQHRGQRRVDDPGDRPDAGATALLGVLPFFHSFGYTVTLWAPLQVGASMVYHADPRQAKEIGELCRKHRCTLFLLDGDVPALLPAALRAGRFRYAAHPDLRGREAAAAAGPGVRGEVRRAAAGGLRLHGAVAGRGGQRAGSR